MFIFYFLRINNFFVYFWKVAPTMFFKTCCSTGSCHFCFFGRSDSPPDGILATIFFGVSFSPFTFRWAWIRKRRRRSRRVAVRWCRWRCKIRWLRCGRCRTLAWRSWCCCSRSCSCRTHPEKSTSFSSVVEVPTLKSLVPVSLVYTLSLWVHEAS